jgi:alpha,alpha-trehalase
LEQFVDEAKSVRVMRSLQKSGLLQPAGIATSLSNTGQQWSVHWKSILSLKPCGFLRLNRFPLFLNRDFPNGWAPLQHLIVEGLLRSGSGEARELAEDIATRWVRTNYDAYKATGAMHEKYDVVTCGKSGGGGEYKPQVWLFSSKFK